MPKPHKSLPQKQPYEPPPAYDEIGYWPWTRRQTKRFALRLLSTACISYLIFYTYHNAIKPRPRKNIRLSLDKLRSDYATCKTLHQTPSPEPGQSRDHNKRWVTTTRPQLIQNATIWTGEPVKKSSAEDEHSGKAYEWINADVLLDKGLIIAIAPGIPADSLPANTQIFEAHGRPLTAGIVDMHSHAGLTAVADLQVEADEMSADITPFVRSLDGLDILHPEFNWIRSGGVTTSLILPGSSNNIGGEAYVIKTAIGEKSGREELSQKDMLADPDGTWRYMKMACGENPKETYGKAGERGPYTRLGEGWEFRHAFEQARDYVRAQNDWCAAADEIGAKNMKTYLPQELRWEALGAVLRGQVRVNTHCYTIADFESFVRLTNEFEFRVYAFHHAHQAYLIPEVLKRAWGGTPAAALFADAMYYKLEAYTASEKAGKILYQHNITPTYVSDDPLLNSQHVILEAARAYSYGLPYHAALAGVTSAPAELLGLGDRLGKIKEGFDADIVVWDSDPLSLGATPVQVWIDGAPQFENPVILKKQYHGPVRPDEALAEDFDMIEVEGSVAFTGIKYMYLGDVEVPFEDAVAIAKNGTLVCVGPCKDELASAAAPTTLRTIRLKNGFITPPFTAFGSLLGLVEVRAEHEMQDGPPPKDGISRPVDGLLFGGKQLASAFEHGVARAVSAPGTGSIDAKGVSVGFRTGAKHALEKGAIWKEEMALHYSLTLNSKTDETPSISSAVGRLRQKLLSAVDGVAKGGTLSESSAEKYEEDTYLNSVVSGTLPLVLSVHSADTISSIIRLKFEIEIAMSATSKPGLGPLKIIIFGGAESHLVAPFLAASNISVILAPLYSNSITWDQRRCLSGAPLTNGTTIDVLLDAGVLVGISVDEYGGPRNLGLLCGIAYANSEGRLGMREALDLAGKNFDRMLEFGGTDDPGRDNDGRSEWVVWEGNPLEIGGRVRGLGTLGRTVVWD